MFFCVCGQPRRWVDDATRSHNHDEFRVLHGLVGGVPILWRKGLTEPHDAWSDGVSAEAAVGWGDAVVLCCGEFGGSCGFVADGAAVGEEAAVQVGDVCGARAFVQVVHVLRHRF